MLSNTTVATIREALTLLKDHHAEWSRNEYGKRKVAELDAALAEIEAQAAGEWLPVEEKFILTCDTGLIDRPKLFVRWNADDESILVGEDNGNFYHCPLPDHIRLCRRTTKGDE